ncbi:hypothetical protein TcasGA2_TC034168 [Tribolium castaneum]|uniref:Uncharacterized protein n=1 Tax=Tribolium castaneum TaxID=7070 RepID=A0A139WD51_TRICA|nr:hypothetical protein TcasGA2_TC034168 [Tribolium castaneum]
MTNNQVMLDEVRIENESKVQSEQLEKLLGNSSVPSVVPAQLPVPLADRRKSESSLLGSFSRIRLSIGNNSKDAPNGHVFSRYFDPVTFGRRPT